MRAWFAILVLSAGCDPIYLVDRAPDLGTGSQEPAGPASYAHRPSCSDGVQSADESDIDCGGPCAPCADGRSCGVPHDCQSAACDSGVCISCSDGVKNGAESDIDCGGGTCFGCALFHTCNRNSDCLSNACSRGICSQPLQLSFATPVDTPIGAGTSLIGVGDFDGDEKLDVVASNAGQIISLLFGNGRGGLPERLDLVGNNDRAASLVTGDFNRDGRDDVAFGGTTGTHALTVILGAYGRKVGAALITQWPALPEGLALGDFNGDKKLDIATSSRYGDGAILGVGDGLGGFQPFVGWHGNGASFTTAGDFNGDGISDLAMSDATGQIDILFGTKNNVFALGGSFMPQIGIPTMGAITSGDFNNDLKTDVIATAWFYPSSWLLAGDGMGHLKSAATFMPDQNVVAAVTADFDFDGNLDVAFACDASRSVNVFRGDGKGNLPTMVTIGPFAGTVTGLALGDFNGDKKIDIVIAQEQGVVTMILNDSN